MNKELGDDYVRRYAGIIRAHEQRLADWRARRPSAAHAHFLNPFAWGAAPTPSRARRTPPTVLSLDPHHLYYLLIRFEALGINVGTLDIHLLTPSRPMSYPNMLALKDRSDTSSIAASFTSTFSAVSKLSLGGSWWGRPELPKLDNETKYIYSSFTKLPGLSLKQNDLHLITELVDDPPVDNAVPMYTFKSLQSLEILDLDPRVLLGWDHLSEILRSLTIKRSGLEDVTHLFVDAVLDDQRRREGGPGGSSPRRRIGLARSSRFASGRFSSRSAVDIPSAVTEDAEPDAPKKPLLPRLKWHQLRHLCLADNALTFFPASILSSITSVTHLDISSNLLVSVPPGLSALHNLTSLNLADNMIDSVLGIYTNLGQVVAINLSKNRLESLCGLERLVALEQIDLRDNRVEDPGEVGRLAVLPNITEVWVEGNPMTQIHEQYRVKCFELFLQDGSNILLDGTRPSFLESRQIQVTPSVMQPSTSGASGNNSIDAVDSRRNSSAPSPPVVAVGSVSLVSPPRRKVGPDPSNPIFPSPHDSKSTLGDAHPRIGSPSSVASTSAAAAGFKSPKKRIARRVVDLDEAGSDTSATYFTSDSSPLGLLPKRSSRHRRGASEGQHSIHTEQEASILPPGLPSDHDVSEVKVSEPIVVQRRAKKKGKGSHHRRYATEGSDNSEDRGVGTKLIAAISLTGENNGLQSTIEEGEDGAEAVDTDPKGMSEGELYRARIDALRQEVGDNWLKVLSQSGGALSASSGSTRTPVR
jgi:Leucine-rich repeat (LRR) protein